MAVYSKSLTGGKLSIVYVQRLPTVLKMYLTFFVTTPKQGEPSSLRRLSPMPKIRVRSPNTALYVLFSLIYEDPNEPPITHHTLSSHLLLTRSDLVSPSAECNAIQLWKLEWRVKRYLVNLCSKWSISSMPAE